MLHYTNVNVAAWKQYNCVVLPCLMCNSFLSGSFEELSFGFSCSNLYP